MGMAATTLLCALMALALRHRWSVVREADFAQFARSDDLVQTALGAVAIGALVTLVALMVWMFRAARNVALLGRRPLKWGPGWAIGAWFIPLANFVIPYLMIDEVHRASDPDRALDWRASRRNPKIWVWMATVGATLVVMRTMPQASTLNNLRTQWLIGTAMTIGLAVATFAAVKVMRTIGARQHQALASLPDTPVATPPGYQAFPVGSWGGAPVLTGVPGGFVPPPPPAAASVPTPAPTGPEFN
jgi:hypothetical protein